MDKQTEQDFLGFDVNSIKSSWILSVKHKKILEAFEEAVVTHAALKHPTMDFSLMRYCSEDGTSSSNNSFKAMVNDNDSGYISQNVESNSSVETTSDNRLIVNTNLKNVYVNEDTLLEKPQVCSKRPTEEEYEEFDHLFYMSDNSEPVLESSVVSQSTSFSGFGDESGISNISGTISVATPLVVSSNILNIDSNSNENVNNNSTSQNCSKSKISDAFMPFASNNTFLDDLKRNNSHYFNVNLKSNLKLISPVHEEVSMEHKSLNINKIDLNCIQTRLMDASACDMSLFESFYSHLCGLYTRNDFPAEDLTKIAINPHNLQITNQAQENHSNSPCKNSYLQLESINKPTVASSSSNTLPKKNQPPNTENNSITTSSANTLLEKNRPQYTKNKPTTVASSSINTLPPKNQPPNIVKKQSELKNKQLEVTSNTPLKKNQPQNTVRKQPELKTKLEVKHVEKKSQIVTSVKKIPLTPPAKQYKNPINPDLSPELFSDEEPTETLSQSFTRIQKTCEQIYITKNDRKLLRYAHESLGGVPPPPSITIIQMSTDEMLQKIKDNKHLFATSSDNTLDVSGDKSLNGCVSSDNLKRDNTKQLMTSKSKAMEMKKSLLVTCKKEDVITESWPRIMQYRYHGLHHNRSRISEDFEHLCIKYAERYIGAETQSSCTVFGMDVSSPSKRKCKLRRASKSPGKRLSHLARRRITFSKDSLQSGVGPSSCSFIGARTRQIMVDARKFELLSRRKSPRKKSPRKTPAKSPRKKQTPSSSTKKRFAMRLRMYNNDESMDSVASTSSSSRASVTKRALFQSPPDKGETTNGLLQIFGSNISGSDSSQSSKRRTPRRALFTSPLRTSPTKMSISSLYPPKRKTTPKRALFMSPGKSPSKSSETCDKKRKRTETDDELPSKLQRSTTLSVKDSLNESKSRTMTRSQSLVGSACLQGQDMAEHRKKKLIWAVAEALRSQNIDMKHPQFKVFASVLARVIRHFLPNLFNNGPRPEGSSTESMLRIARQHVFAVTRGKTVNQILRESENTKMRPTKPTGYVGLDKVDKPNSVVQAKNKENVLQDRVNIIGSDRLGSESSHVSKNSRGESVERIRRVINFGDDDDVGNPTVR